ncbi:MAG: hypothetical protein WCO99_13620 [Planctomycetota bacterium]
MHRDPVRRALTWGAAATLLLPIVIAVVLGLGGLLGGLGDTPGARVCAWIGLAIGAVWITAIVATTAINAITVLERRPSRRPRHGRTPRRRGRRRRDERSLPGLPERPVDRPT